MIAQIQTISDSVMAGLAAANLPPLSDGRIRVGKRHLASANAPPRVVFIPRRSKFKVPEMYQGSGVYGTDEARAQWLARNLQTEEKHFEVHVFGPVAPSDSDESFELTEWLAHQVIRSTHQLFAGSYGVDDGDWEDQVDDSSQALKTSHHFVFGLSLDVPVTDDPLQFVSEETTQEADIAFDNGDDAEPEAP
jgi:hypothetical protein